MIDLRPAHRALAKQRRHGNAIRLYWWLGFELDHLEYRPVKIERMAREVGMDRSGVCRAIKILCQYDLIQRNGRDGPRGPYTYRLILNPRDPTVRETPTNRAA
jgi:hypothetical protein